MTPQEIDALLERLDSAHIAEFDAAAACIRELREDAERYRWIRDPRTEIELVIFKKSCLKASGELDAAIDSARKEGK